MFSQGNTLPSMACHFLLMTSFCSCVRGISKTGCERVMVGGGGDVLTTSSTALSTLTLKNTFILISILVDLKLI